MWFLKAYCVLGNVLGACLTYVISLSPLQPEVGAILCSFYR